MCCTEIENSFKVNLFCSVYFDCLSFINCHIRFSDRKVSDPWFDSRERATRCYGLGKGTLCLFPTGVKQSSRCGGLGWRKTCKQNPKKYSALVWLDRRLGRLPGSYERTSFLNFCNCNYILFINLPWPKDSERTFWSSNQAIPLPTCLPPTVEASHCPFNAEHQVRKQWIPVFLVFGLTRLGIEPESTVLVSDPQST